VVRLKKFTTNNCCNYPEEQQQCWPSTTRNSYSLLILPTEVAVTL